MTTLPTAVKMHILTELACFATPQQVATSVQEKFGLTLSRQRVEAYHPERHAGARLHPSLRALFYETRAKLRAELDNIPIAHKAYRLWQMERLMWQCERTGNIAMAVQFIEQAAKEMGGMYERRGPAPARRAPSAVPPQSDYRIAP